MPVTVFRNFIHSLLLLDLISSGNEGRRTENRRAVISIFLGPMKNGARRPRFP